MTVPYTSLQHWHLTGIGKLSRALIAAAFICAGTKAAVNAAEPLPTPTWLNGKRELLPPVAPEIVAAVKRTRADLPKTSIDSMLNNTHDETDLREAIEIYKLGDQAGLAMVWWYAEDIPLEGEEKYAIANEKWRILGSIHDDPTLAGWVLPLLRARLVWAEDKFKAGKLDEAHFDSDELGSIEGYLGLHGTTQDWKNVKRVEREIAQSNARIAYGVSQLCKQPASEENLASELEVNEARRRSRKPYMRPFINMFRWVEKYVTSPQGAGAKNPTPIGSPAAEAVRPASSKAQYTSASQPESHSMLVWLLVVIAAAVGAVWVFLRKSK